MPMAVRVSIVAEPMCGSRNTFLSDKYPGFSLMGDWRLWWDIISRKTPF